MAPRRGERGLAVDNRLDAVTRIGEQALDVGPHVGIVVGEEHQLTPAWRRGLLRAQVFGPRGRGRLVLHLREPGQRLFHIGLGALPGGSAATVGADLLGGKVGLARRHRHRKGGPLIDAARHRDVAAVQLHQFLHQGKADAAAFDAAPARALDAAKALEQVRQLLSSDVNEYLQAAPFLAVVPGIAIVLSVLGFNMIGDGLREALDPKLRGRA